MVTIRLAPNRGGYAVQYRLSCGHKTAIIPLIQYPQSRFANAVNIADSHHCEICHRTTNVVSHQILIELIDPRTITEEEKTEFKMAILRFERLERRLRERRWDFFMMVAGVVLGTQTSLIVTTFAQLYHLEPVMVLLTNAVAICGVLILTWWTMHRYFVVNPV
jgi:hypothetical protein